MLRRSTTNPTTPVKVAIVQHAPAFLDLNASVERAVTWMEEAAGAGADLVVFGETWLPGYPAWIFGAAGWDDAEAKAVHGQLMRNAVEIPGPATKALGDACQRLKIHLAMGANELDTQYSRGTLYNSILLFDDTGTLLGVHRKLVPTHAERLVWGHGDASGLRVHETKIGRIGGLVCWEHWMPLARFALHAQAEQIHLALWPEVVEMHQIASRHYAFEGRAFVVCAGSFLSRADVPADFKLKGALGDLGDFGQDEALLIPGGSGVIAPDGAWIAGPLTGSAGIVYADIDLHQAAGEQLAFDSAGHYNRPDIFQLSVDMRPRSQITLRRDGDPDPAS